MEKESKRLDYQRTFLPHVLWLYSIAALVLSTVALWAYIGAFLLLFAYEYTLGVPGKKTLLFFRTLSRSFIFFLCSFVLIYGIFLQVGSHEWFSIQIMERRWVWTYESLVFGVHYAVVLVVLLWIAYLIHQQKRISTLQYYFTGSLYPLTVLWNHTLHTLNQMMAWKSQYQRALRLRHIHMGTVAYMKNMVLFIFDRAFWEVRHKLPVVTQRWQQNVRAPSTWVEKMLFALPLLFISLAFVSKRLAAYNLSWVHFLLWGLSFAMIFEVYRKQRVVLQRPAQWRLGDVMVLLALVCAWTAYAYGRQAPWNASIISDLSVYVRMGLAQASVIICLAMGFFVLVLPLGGAKK